MEITFSDEIYILLESRVRHRLWLSTWLNSTLIALAFIPTTYKPDQIPFMKHQFNSRFRALLSRFRALLCPLTSPTPTIPQTNSIHLRLLHSRTNRRLLSVISWTEPGPDNSTPLQAMQLCREKGSMEGVPWGKHDKRPLKQSLLLGVGAAIAPVTALVAR